MFTCKNVCAPVIVTICLLGSLVAEDQTTPSREYLEDDIQYFPDMTRAPGAVGENAPAAADAVPGKALFHNVISVWFSGPGRPFGILTAEAGGTITVYEEFVVHDIRQPDGQIHRTVYPVDSLGKIEQRFRR